MSEPQMARDYHERDVQAAYSVLIPVPSPTGRRVAARPG